MHNTHTQTQLIFSSKLSLFFTMPYYYSHYPTKPILLPLIDNIDNHPWQPPQTETQHPQPNARNKKQKQAHLHGQNPIYTNPNPHSNPNPNPNIPLQAIPIQGSSKSVNSGMTRNLNFTPPKPTLVKVFNSGKLNKIMRSVQSGYDATS